MNIRFYLERNNDRFGDRRIMCKIQKNSNVFTISTKAKIKSDLWNQKKQRQKDNSIGSPELNSYLNKFQIEVKKIIDRTRAKNIFASFSDVKQAVKEHFNSNGSDLFVSFEKYIELTKPTFAKSTTQKYINLKNILTEYQTAKETILTFAGLNKLFFDGFYEFLINHKKHSVNTANKNIKLFQTFLKWCADRELHNNYTFQKVKLKGENVEYISISLSELQKIIIADFGSNDKLDKVRDLFVFQTLTGLRYSDLAKIKRSNIKDNILRITITKTKQPLEIVLPNLAIKILEKYKKLTTALPQISNVNYNLFIKELCKEAGITEVVAIDKIVDGVKTNIECEKYELVTTHTARRTYVTLGLQLGLRPELVMQGTGHSSISSFQKYISMNKSEALNEIKNTFDKIEIITN